MALLWSKCTRERFAHIHSTPSEQSLTHVFLLHSSTLRQISLPLSTRPEFITIKKDIQYKSSSHFLCFTLSYVFSIDPSYRSSDWYLLDNKLVGDISEQVGSDVVLSAHRLDSYIATCAKAFPPPISPPF